MSKLTFDHVIATLGLESQRDAWRCYWPATDTLGDVTDSWLFTPGRLAEVCDWLGHSAEVRAALADSLASVLALDARKTLLAQAIRVFGTANAQPAPIPTLPADLGPWAPLFQALMVLGCIPETRRRHELRCIPDAITRDTFNDVQRWMLASKETTGQWAFHSSGWVFNHVSGRLFELGRLQFGRTTCDLPVHFYVGKECESGRIVALVSDGQRVRPDGQFLTADRGAQQHGPHFVTTLKVTDDAVTGHVVNHVGAIESSTTTLPFKQWTRTLDPFSPVIDVHIPAGSPLSDAACADSFKQAAAFFPRYFPEHVFKGYTCTSWLMDPQLALRLPAEANTVKFLRRFHWLPCTSGNDFQTFERVFGGYVDIAKAPRDTSMKRAVLEHVEVGGLWRSASGVILREEVSA